MKTKYIATIFMGGLMASSLIGCEDRLDIAKHGNLGGMEDFYQTDADAEQASVAMYSSWRSMYYTLNFGLNLLSDDVWCGGGSRGDNSDMEKVNEYTFDSESGTVKSLYTGFYGLIYKANLGIDKLSDDTPTKKRVVAEGKFFRAFSNFYLVTLFGEVPLVDHLLQPSEYKKARSTKEDIWASIESDLKDAIEVLPSKTSVNDNETVNRITKEAAEAYLGKSYLFQGKYDQAATELDKVINSKLYDLWNGSYDKLLHAETNNCCENILEAQLRNDAEQAWNQFSMFYLMTGWRTNFMTVSPEAQNWLAMGTYGFLTPRQGLYDAFVEMEGKNGARLKASIRSYEQLKDVGISWNAGAIQVGSDGYWFWKNRCLKEDCIYDASYFQALQYVHYRFMRYPEVLLMAAEAKVMSGNNDGKATEYVNLIRKRAGLTPLSDVTLDDIKKEKRLELCLEMCRYQDLIRWGDAEKALKDQGKEIHSFTVKMDGDVATPVIDKKAFANSNGGFKERNQLLPIPLQEIELNTGLNGENNPGW